MTQFRIRLLSISTEQHTTVSPYLSVSVSDISGTIFVNLVQTIDLLILFEENLKEIYIYFVRIPRGTSVRVITFLSSSKLGIQLEHTRCNMGHHTLVAMDRPIRIKDSMAL